MLSLLAALAIGQTGEGYILRVTHLPAPNGKPSRLDVTFNEGRLDPPKLSPKLFGDPPTRWEFEWITYSSAPDDPPQLDPKTGEPMKRIRFRVFSQERRPYGTDKAPMVARQAIRMWDLMMSRFRFANNEAINGSIVDYYLCWGGQAGGEQLMGEEIVRNRPVTVSTIYIYDLKSFDSPVEMAREVAHEYGHAVLPGVRGYTAPEDWANGYLGEKLFMRWLRDEMVVGHLGTDDTMGTTLKDMNAWVKANVDTLVTKAASAPPSAVGLADKGPVGMDNYIGLVLYADTIFPHSVAGRSLKLMGSQDAKDYPEALYFAMREMPKITLSIPDYLKNKPIWIPLAGGKVAQAQVLKRSGDWAQIMPQAGGVVITTGQGSSSSKGGRSSKKVRLLRKAQSRR